MSLIKMQNLNHAFTEAHQTNGTLENQELPRKQRVLTGKSYTKGSNTIKYTKTSIYLSHWLQWLLYDHLVLYILSM